ncbi:MAG TPA: hypothetical protein VH500_04350 [Nitrososphaeraceae archaeon]
MASIVVKLTPKRSALCIIPFSLTPVSNNKYLLLCFVLLQIGVEAKM